MRERGMEGMGQEEYKGIECSWREGDRGMGQE